MQSKHKGTVSVMNIRVTAGGQSFLFLVPADVVTIFGTVQFSWESTTLP